ncbi:MEKHLA domain-containing protein [Inquilinus limosus]
MSLAHDPDFLRLLAGSHARLVGTPLLPEEAGGDAAVQARWLYEAAPFCVLVHNTDADPPSSMPTERPRPASSIACTSSRRCPPASPPRRRTGRSGSGCWTPLPADGFITSYRDLRVAKSGRRFWIENATVWRLIDEAGTLHGQAATFRD